jgi:hypothetical protein
VIRPPHSLRRSTNIRELHRRKIESTAKEHRHRGYLQGTLEERERLIGLLEDPDTRIIYMQPRPEPRYRVVPPPRDMFPLFGSHERRVLDISDVEAVPYALSLTNGRTIRWWGWRQVL